MRDLGADQPFRIFIGVWGKKSRIDGVRLRAVRIQVKDPLCFPAWWVFRDTRTDITLN